MLSSVLSCTYCRVSSHNYMVITQMALHIELVNRGRIVHPNFGLLSIVSDTHANVILATLTPNVVGHLKTDYNNALVYLSGPFT